MAKRNKRQRNIDNADNRRLFVKIQNYLDKKFDEIDLFGLLSVWAVCVLTLMAFVVLLVYISVVAQSWFYNLVMGTADAEALLENEEIL